MLPELMTWWARQMADLAAPILHRFRAATPDGLLLVAGPSGLRIERRRKGRIIPVGTLATGGDPVGLRRVLGRRPRVPVVVVLPGPLLVREATLPAAAQGSLDRVLGYEMDRLTPFSADEVYFSHRLLELDRARGILKVELALVPRRLVQPLLGWLAPSGIVPGAVEAAGPDGIVRRVPIGHVDPVRQARERVLARIAPIVCGILAAVTIAIPLVRQSLALADVEARIDELRPRVQQVETLRKRIAEGSAGAGQIAAARQQAGLILQMLGVLTDTLPDDTWLTSLTLRQRGLLLEGHSKASTKVIAAMAIEPRLQDPAFAAPVLRGENGSEVFTIQAGFGS
jgi:general secretion pathway protein L